MKKTIASLALLCVAAFAQDSKLAMAELEREANKWIASLKDGSNSYEAPESKYFTFKYEVFKYENVPKFAPDSRHSWTATGKEKIGGCPAKSEWSLHGECADGCAFSGSFPKKCKSITPKVITANADGDEEDYR